MGVKSIFDEKKFIDHLYIYYKLNSDLKNEDIPEVEKGKMQRKSCKEYIIALRYCLKKIQELPNGCQERRCYLNWLRWNRNTIIEEINLLEKYQMAIPDICRNNIDAVIEELFHFSEDEKAISNEYVHAYQMAFNPCQRRKKVFAQAGRLFINYLNILKNRCYIEKLDRDGVTFTELYAEGEYLISKLKDIDADLASNVKDINEYYAKFRESDDKNRQQQIVHIKEQVEIAHLRATETFLQSAVRKIKETLDFIKQEFDLNVQKIREEIISMHPRKIVEKIKNSILKLCTEPLQTGKEIVEWARKNPFKAVGALIAGTFFILNPVSTTLLGLTILGGKATYSSLAILDKYSQIRAKYREKVMNASAELKKVKDNIVDDATKIGAEALYKESLHRVARDMMDEELREAQKADEERVQNIRKMNHENAVSLYSSLSKEIEVINTDLDKTEQELAKRENSNRKREICLMRINELEIAIDEYMQNIADSTPLPPESLNAQ